MLLSLIQLLLLCASISVQANTPLPTFTDTDPLTGAMLECDFCPPGTYLRARCTSTHRSRCAPCPSGSFTELWNHIGKCFRCGSCGQNQVVKQPCLPNSDCRCECKPGYFYRQKYDMCIRHSVCPVGQGVLRNGRSAWGFAGVGGVLVIQRPELQVEPGQQRSEVIIKDCPQNTFYSLFLQ